MNQSPSNIPMPNNLEAGEKPVPADGAAAAEYAQPNPETHELPIPSMPIPHPKTTNPASAGQTAVPVPIPAAPIAQPQTISDDALAAEDVDLIEKAWVMKAKAIVDKTRNDPHLQNKEINKVKAAYIKRRYNKDIKVTEE